MADIKVLIIDDSALIRSNLAKGLNKINGITVVGTAIDPYIARDKILSLTPDVITLDIEMPRMDGLTFLSKLMTFYPIPVIILSSLAPEGSVSYFKALDLGALDVISKPDSAYGQSIMQQIGLIGEKIKEASKTNMAARRAVVKLSASHNIPINNNFKANSAMIATTEKIIAIGASTGGTQTFRPICKSLPANCPPTLVVQHMPPHFTKSYAESLNAESTVEVREASDGDTIHSGLVLIAPGNYHMLLNRSGARYYVTLNQKPHIHHVRPAVDVLFNTVAKYAGKNAVGVVLTGMGSDGARGLLAMKEAGAKTVIQDEDSCIVYGMPKAAFEIGAATSHTLLENISNKILTLGKSE